MARAKRELVVESVYEKWNRPGPARPGPARPGPTRPDHPPSLLKTADLGPPVLALFGLFFGFLSSLARPEPAGGAYGCKIRL